MSDIFISYATEDRPRVKPLVDALQEKGWSVWWDPTIVAGKTFDQAIEAALKDSRCVVVLWSRHSIESHWVRTEAYEGWRRGILVPALLDNVDIPLAFRIIQAANLIGWSGGLPSAQFNELARAVSEVLSTFPCSDSTSEPKGAVFLTYAEADQSCVFEIAGNITSCGAAVFLDAACMRPDAESHVLNALSFADEVLILMTPTPADPQYMRSTPAFLDHHYVWSATAVARDRGIPIGGLLVGLTDREVIENQTIPRFIRAGKLFEMAHLKSHLADLLKRLPKARPEPAHRPGLECRVCLCCGVRSAPGISGLEERLGRVGVELSVWRSNSTVANFDAAVVVPGDQSFDTWNPQLVSFVERFVRIRKPVALLVLPSGQTPTEVPEWLKRGATCVEYHPLGNLSLLQLAWTIVGYRQYDIVP